MKQFQQYGITAEVRDDGDLFIRAADVTIGHAEKMEVFDFLTNAIFGDDRPFSVEDLETADEFNNADYRAGTAPVVETNIEGDPSVSSAPEVGEGSVAVVQPTVQNADVEIPTEVGAPIRKRGPGRPRKNAS